MMNRRQLLKTLTALGGIGATSLLSGNAIAAAQHFRGDATAASPALLSVNALETLRRICALTIPQTSTPGAAEVMCHHFIDHQLSVVYGEEEQQSAIALLASIDKNATSFGAKQFSLLNEASQLRLLTALEKAEAPFSAAQKGTFKFLKSLIVFGYYTSQPGATKELTYLPLPGGFKGSVPLASVGSAYSSKAYY